MVAFCRLDMSMDLLAALDQFGLTWRSHQVFGNNLNSSAYHQRGEPVIRSCHYSTLRPGGCNGVACRGPGTASTSDLAAKAFPGRRRCGVEWGLRRQANLVPHLEYSRPAVGFVGVSVDDE